MEREWTPLQTTTAVSAVATAIAFAIGLISPGLTLPATIPAYVRAVVRVELFFATFNSFMMIVMVIVYGRIYRQLPNKYTASLTLLGVALLLYAVTSHPLVHIVFGFSLSTVGAFTFIPDLFVSMAVIILFYQSQT